MPDRTRKRAALDTLKELYEHHGRDLTARA